MTSALDGITAEAVRCAVDGDRVALEAILRALERPFFTLALRMLASVEDAEDAAQECLLRVTTRLAQFDGRSRFSTWAWRVAVRRILDFRDSAARISFEAFAAGLTVGLEPEAPERPDDLVEIGELKMACSRALLQCLDAPERLAFVLGHILELDGPEAAAILEIDSAAFRKRLSRARDRLSAALRGQCGIVNPSAACRCHARLAKARALGRVAPGRTTTERPLAVGELRASLAAIEPAQRAVAYYRADPASVPRRDLVRAALAPFAVRSSP
jgi:RNA polymerase sigma factor (sigma-70 family)